MAKYRDQEALRLVIHIDFDPNTRYFKFTSRVNEDFDEWRDDVRRGGSPTRFAASLDCWLNKAVDHFRAYVVERWDDELSRDVVVVPELLDAFEEMRPDV